jgi:hypothetical protein
MVVGQYKGKTAMLFLIPITYLRIPNSTYRGRKALVTLEYTSHELAVNL